MSQINDFFLECCICGSHDVMVTMPDVSDMEHPKLNYLCRNCGEISSVDCKIDGVSEDGKLQVSIVQEPKLIIA